MKTTQAYFSRRRGEMNVKGVTRLAFINEKKFINIANHRERETVKQKVGTTNRRINMKRIILGVTYCFLWYISILVGFFLFICPLLPLVFFHPKLYRKWSETVFGMWEPFPVALMEIFFGIRAVLTGDQIDPFERSLLIMNHRTRLDWNFLWVGLFHCCHPYSHALKYVLKSAVMHFPGPGWVMQTCSFLFVHRNWTRDQKLLERLIKYLDISDEPYQILIFPEGTDLTPGNILKSHKYADEHNFERYYNVLHPKTTGFAFIANKMKLSGKINAVYDITVGYPGEAPQNESDLLKGNFPEEVHFHVRRYCARELPLNQDGLRDWLNGVWKKKEVLLTQFQKTGSFSHLEERSSLKLKQTRNGRTIPNDESDSRSTDNSFPNKSENQMSNEPNNEAVEADTVNNPPEDSNFSNASADQQPSDTVTELEEEMDDNAEQSSSHNHGKVNNSITSDISLPEKSTCTNDSLLNKYRPSHLLYLTFLFWIALIYFTTHQFIVNYYVQMWVLIHAIFFSSISFLSEGFHHIIASIYFYRYNIKGNVDKKHN